MNIYVSINFYYNALEMHVKTLPINVSIKPHFVDIRNKTLNNETVRYYATNYLRHIESYLPKVTAQMTNTRTRCKQTSRPHTSRCVVSSSEIKKKYIHYYIKYLTLHNFVVEYLLSNNYVEYSISRTFNRSLLRIDIYYSFLLFKLISNDSNVV